MNSTIYKRNQKSVSPVMESMYVVEYFKQKRAEIEGTDGSPVKRKSTIKPRRNMNLTQIQEEEYHASNKKDEAYERELRYAFELIKNRAELNVLENEDEQEKMMPLDSNKKVLDMMANKDNKSLHNVARCFVAKQKIILSLFNDDFKLIVPEKFQWHEKHRNCDNFTDKLNLANIGTL